MTFSNPYKDKPNLVRLQTYISTEDHGFLFLNLHPGQGSVTIVTNTLISKLVEALKKANITDHSTQRLEFEAFVAEMEISQPKRKKK